MSFKNKDELHEFVYKLIEVSPPEFLPDYLIIESDILKNLKFNCFQAPSKIIWFKTKEEVVAEKQYKSEIEKLKDRVRKLELEENSPLGWEKYPGPQWTC